MEAMTHGDRAWKLERLPLRSDDPLRAWSTADLYLLRHAEEAGLLGGGARVLVVNDAFGALGVPLAGLASMSHKTSSEAPGGASRSAVARSGGGRRRACSTSRPPERARGGGAGGSQAAAEGCETWRPGPTWWSDSFTAARALRHNLALNGLDEGAVTTVPGDRTPEGPFDVVLMRLPKALAWQEDQLLRLRPQLAADALVVAGGMIKHTPRRAFELLEACLGPTTTSQGWKKARLAFARVDPELEVPGGVAPQVVDVDGLPIASRPNVFSWDSLDLGARVLLGSLGASERALRIVDQGCGSGVLALALARAYPNATVLGMDESYQAVASARDNAAAAGLGPERVRFEVGDDLREVVDGEVDLVVCNPPFHQAHAVGDQVAWGMFGQARRVLARGGEYLVVGNRHLHYHEKLRRLFGGCAVVDSDKRFVVLRSKRT